MSSTWRAVTGNCPAITTGLPHAQPASNAGAQFASYHSCSAFSHVPISDPPPRTNDRLPRPIHHGLIRYTVGLFRQSLAWLPHKTQSERTMSQPLRVFATCDIGESINLLRERGYDVEVYPKPEPPPKSLIIEKLKSGIDGLITTLRDQVDAELFEAGKGHLKVVAQYAVGFDNINRADANRYRVPFTNTPDVLTEATAEFA